MANITGTDIGIMVKNEVTLTTGQTTVLASPYNWLVTTNTGTIAAQTVTLPTAPFDGQFVLVSNLGAITALTFSPAVTGFSQASALAAGNGLWIAWSSNLNVWFVMNF